MKIPEANHPPQPARHREATDQFLLSKTDTLPQPSSVSHRQLSVAAEVLSAFPELRSGSAFLTHALEHLDGVENFGALVVRMDPRPADEKSATKADSVARQLHIAKVIDHACRSNAGVWGQVNLDLFGCFLPSLDLSAIHDLAQKIQQDFKKKADATVSIGLSAYPLLDYSKRQALDNAHKALRHAAFFGPGTCTAFDAVSLNISGDEKYQNGDVEGAVQEFEMGLRLDPNNVNLHNSLGVCFGVLNQHEKAWAAFDAAAQLDSCEVMALYNAGLIRFLQNRHAEALEQFLKAAELDENLYELALQTGTLYLAMQKPQKGLPYLKKATRLHPSSGRPFAYLGRCYNALHMKDLAIAAFKKAIRQNPFDAESLSALGLLYGEKGENPDIATLFCQKSIDISPDNGMFRSHLGRLHLQYGRLQEALGAFEEASERGWDATADIEKIRVQLTEKAS